MALCFHDATLTLRIRWGITLAMRRPLCLLTVTLLAGCENPVGLPRPVPDPVRTVVYKRAQNHGLFAVRADGTGEVRLRVPAALDSMTPIGMSRDGGRLAFLGGDGIYTYRPADSTSLRRILARPGGQILPAGLSDDGRYLALVVFVPGRSLLISADLTLGTLDTLPTGVTDPVLPPIFSPDNSRIAVIGANDFTLEIAQVERTTGITFATNAIGGSRFVDIPIFGWPRWIPGQGILLAVRRQPLNDPTGPDTLYAVSVDPSSPGRGYRRRFAAISHLRFESASTFAFSTDGNAIVYGAFAGESPSQGIFFQSPNTPEILAVLDEPGVSEIFPLVVNGTLPVPLH